MGEKPAPNWAPSDPDSRSRPFAAVGQPMAATDAFDQHPALIDQACAVGNASLPPRRPGSLGAGKGPGAGKR